MGFGRITVNTTDVDSTAGKLRVGADGIRHQLDLLVGEVASVTTHGWTGGAAAAFSSHYAELNTAWRQVEVALEHLAVKLRATSAAYADNEQAIAGQFRR
ncbi:MAG TPA: WXG100 family type VII secretion target [Acidimicrobiales bacterium]|nr:WXG100 family type VII secretion target [Acidimicrobiales bacterium]